MDNRFIVATLAGAFVLVNVFLWIILPKKMREDSKTLGRIYAMKKYTYLTVILLINISLCCVSYLYNEYRVAFYVVLIMKSRDVITASVWIISLVNEVFGKIKWSFISIGLVCAIFALLIAQIVLGVIYGLTTITSNPYNVIAVSLCLGLLLMALIIYSYITYGSEIKPIVIENKIIVSVIPVYGESSEQVGRTIDSIVENELGSNKNLICVICDGKPIDLEKSMSVLNKESSKYVSWKMTNGTLDILYCSYKHSGKDTPCVILKKRENQGKKDTLILSHDIFNFPRDTLTAEGINLRAHIRKQIDDFYSYGSFDYMFCTDADSIITSNSFLDMLETLDRRHANACCGLVVIDFINSNWSAWNLFQNFQYSYGQHIRRGCENLIGTVTCMPGCITMFRITPVASKALKLYATPPPKDELILNCVQMLGTDRRLASSFLYQSPDLVQVLDYRAKCYTIPPDDFSSYLSQRRRWGSNFYFNSICNLFGDNISPFIRFLCIFDIVRFSLDFFRLFSTCLFLYAIGNAIVTRNNGIVVVLIPTLSILLFPTASFLIYALFNRFLFRMYHKLLIGYLINKLFSAYLSMIIITNVFWNMGSVKWGGVSSNASPPPPGNVSSGNLGNLVINIPPPTVAVTLKESDAEVMDVF